MCRGTNGFKKGYQPRTNRVKDEKGDLVGDSHSILGRLRNYISKLLNLHGVNGVRQTYRSTFNGSHLDVFSLGTINNESFRQTQLVYYN